jgi:hypothetical protein
VAQASSLVDDIGYFDQAIYVGVFRAVRYCLHARNGLGVEAVSRLIAHARVQGESRASLGRVEPGIAGRTLLEAS